MKKKFDAAFKAKVALEAIKGQKTLAELARVFRKSRGGMSFEAGRLL